MTTGLVTAGILGTRLLFLRSRVPPPAAGPPSVKTTPLGAALGAGPVGAQAAEANRPATPRVGSRAASRVSVPRGSRFLDAAVLTVVGGPGAAHGRRPGPSASVDDVGAQRDLAVSVADAALVDMDGGGDTLRGHIIRCPVWRPEDS
jgi:hypothetical protein